MSLQKQLFINNALSIIQEGDRFSRRLFAQRTGAFVNANTVCRFTSLMNDISLRAQILFQWSAFLVTGAFSCTYLPLFFDQSKRALIDNTPVCPETWHGTRKVQGTVFLKELQGNYATILNTVEEYSVLCSVV